MWKRQCRGFFKASLATSDDELVGFKGEAGFLNKLLGTYTANWKSLSGM
jgi:hypothetical protein